VFRRWSLSGGWRWFFSGMSRIVADCCGGLGMGRHIRNPFRILEIIPYDLQNPFEW
jgi:hypothetical protein